MAIDDDDGAMSNSVMRISESEKGQVWLRQFRPEFVPNAIRLLDNFEFVSTADFRGWMASEIVRQAKKGRLALYGEREFNPNARFFPTLKPGKVKRAIGPKGPDLVKPIRGSPYVGSEGIIGQLLSELSRRKDIHALLTPGPDRLRPIKSRGPTRRIAIVTDMIGSGTRIRRMLDALWRTESFRSWYSHRSVPLEVLVIAYATSPKGIDRIKSHRIGPEVIVRSIAPTIWDIDADDTQFRALCEYHEPRPCHDDAGPFGYRNAGTLIAFGHGCPNTAPPIFWHSSRDWKPLFPQRSGVEFDLLDRPSQTADFSHRLLALNSPTLADANLLAKFESLAREALLLLAAISHGLRGSVMLASRTGLEVSRVESLLSTFRSAEWITDSGTITKQGLTELRAAAKMLPTDRYVPFDAVSVYYPTSLRG